MEGNPLGARPLLAPIIQPVIPILLITPPPPPQRPWTPPQYVRRLQPADPPSHRSQYHFLHFHDPRLLGGPVMLHAPHIQPSIPSPPKRSVHVSLHRSLHLLPTPHICP